MNCPRIPPPTYIGKQVNWGGGGGGEGLGDRWREPGSTGGGKSSGVGGRGGGRQDIEGGGRREKCQFFWKRCAIFRHIEKKHAQAETATEGGENRECAVREAGNSTPLSPSGYTPPQQMFQTN